LQQRGNIVLIDRNMQQLVNTFVPFGKPLPKAVVPRPIERTFATGKPQVTGLFMAPIVNQFMFGITVPVDVLNLGGGAVATTATDSGGGCPSDPAPAPWHPGCGRAALPPPPPCRSGRRAYRGPPRRRPPPLPFISVASSRNFASPS
jgi:hypothetical protein